jgi:hypothetical protein
MIKHLIIENLKSLILSFPTWNVYTYTDSSIDITQTIIGRSKVDLPLGTETSFIFQVNLNGTYYDAVNPEDENYLKYRYLLRTKLDGTKEYKLISNYNNTTGLLTFSTPFGEAITTSDVLEVVVLDSLYISDSNHRMGSGKYISRENNLFVGLDFKTKLDSNKSKMRNYIDIIQTIIGTNFYQLEIKNSSNVTLGYATFSNEGDYNEALDSGEQLIKYYGIIILQYRTTYGMVF